MIQLLLVDDHDLVRSGLRRLLEEEPDFHIVGEAVLVKKRSKWRAKVTRMWF